MKRTEVTNQVFRILLEAMGFKHCKCYLHEVWFCADGPCAQAYVALEAGAVAHYGEIEAFDGSGKNVDVAAFWQWLQDNADMRERCDYYDKSNAAC